MHVDRVRTHPQSILQGVMVRTRRSLSHAEYASTPLPAAKFEELLPTILTCISSQSMCLVQEIRAIAQFASFCTRYLSKRQLAQVQLATDT